MRRKKVWPFQYKRSFFLDISHTWLVESMNVASTDRDGQQYILCFQTFQFNGGLLYGPAYV